MPTHGILVRPVHGQELFDSRTTLIIEQRKEGQANIRLRRYQASEASNFRVATIVRALRDLGYKEEILAGLYDEEDEE